MDTSYYQFFDTMTYPEFLANRAEKFENTAPTATRQPPRKEERTVPRPTVHNSVNSLSPEEVSSKLKGLIDLKVEKPAGLDYYLFLQRTVG